MMATCSETVTGEATIRIADDTMKIEVTVPAGPTDAGTLLPIFQRVTSALVDRAVEGDGGRPVSCRAGCGACCRQPVPVAPSEARAIAALVAALPPPQHAAVRQRFAAARTTLAAAGVLIDLDALRTMPIAEQIAWGAAYMATGVACPFLVAEACSIYPGRPVICRDYLVTTPAENCRVPAPETIPRVPLQVVRRRAGGARPRSRRTWADVARRQPRPVRRPSTRAAGPQRPGADRGGVQAAGRRFGAARRVAEASEG